MEAIVPEKRMRSHPSSPPLRTSFSKKGSQANMGVDGALDSAKEGSADGKMPSGEGDERKRKSRDESMDCKMSVEERKCWRKGMSFERGGNRKWEATVDDGGLGKEDGEMIGNKRLAWKNKLGREAKPCLCGLVQIKDRDDVCCCHHLVDQGGAFYVALMDSDNLCLCLVDELHMFSVRRLGVFATGTWS